MNAVRHTARVANDNDAIPTARTAAAIQDSARGGGAKAAMPLMPAPHPLSPQPPVDTQPVGRERAALDSVLLSALLLWSLALGAAAALLPDALPPRLALLGLVASGSLALHIATTWRLPLALMVPALLAFAVLGTLGSTEATLLVPGLSGALALFAAGAAERDGNGVFAGAVSAALLVACAVVAVLASPLDALAVLLPGAVAFAGLGLARAAVAAGFDTAPAHYLVCWTGAALCAFAAVALELVPSLSAPAWAAQAPEYALVAAIAGATALVVWGLQGVRALLQAVAVAALAAHWLGLVEFDVPSLPLVAGVGLAASLALGVRGVRGRSVAALAVAGLAGLAFAGALLRLGLVDGDALVAGTLAAGFAATALLAARAL